MNHVIIHPKPGLCTSPSFCANYRQHCLVETSKSWLDAQSHCRERGSDLATIDDMGAMESLLPLIASKPDAVWIGLYPGGPRRWHWSLADDGFYKEGQREYRNFINVHEHNFVTSKDGIWIHGSLAHLHHPMCYDDNKQGWDRCVLGPQTMHIPAARDYCREHHKDLVSIRNQTENQIIQEAAAANCIWIGLFRDPWIWSDMRYSSFRFGIAGDFLVMPSAGYLTVIDPTSGRWASRLCGEQHLFLCTCKH